MKRIALSRIILALFVATTCAASYATDVAQRGSTAGQRKVKSRPRPNCKNTYASCRGRPRRKFGIASLNRWMLDEHFAFLQELQCPVRFGKPRGQAAIGARYRESEMFPWEP